MAGLVTNQAQITLLSTEQSTNNVLVNRSIQPSFDGDTELGMSYAVTLPAPVGLVLPVGFDTAYQFYLRNIGPAGSIKLQLTPIGTTPVTVCLLGPGDIFLYWATTKTAPLIGTLGQGFVAGGTVTGSVAGIQFEFFIGA